MGGQSSSRVSVENDVLNFTGVCAIVPSLKAPGFITAVTGNGLFGRETFVDASSCKGLTIVAKDYTAGYKGYGISFGLAKYPCTGPRACDTSCPARLHTTTRPPFSTGCSPCRGGASRGRPPGGKFFAQGYKADLHPTVGSFGAVSIPFTNFTDFWDDATGKHSIAWHSIA